MRTLTILFALSLAASAQSAPAAKQKVQPPAPAAPRPYEFPKAASKTLANGLKVFVIEDHRLPLVSAALQVLAGNAYVEPAKSGLASMTAGLLREGTATRSSQQLAKTIDTAGGNLSTSAGDDTASVSMTFMKSFAGLGFELMADVTRNPAFAQEEIDRQMRQAQSGLAVEYADAEYLAPLAAARAMLGMHPYAFPGGGTPGTLNTIKRDDIVAFYKANYAPNRAWMAIAGDVTPEEGFALAEKNFGGWKVVGRPDEKLPAPPAPKPQVLIIDMPNAVQTQIVVGHLGVPRNDPDYLALQLGNQIFGGSFNSRLNMKLRANEGLTYGATSSFEPNRFAGTFQATTFTRTEKTAAAIGMLVDLLNEFKQNPATEAEFKEAQAYMTGSFGIATETAGAVAGRVLAAEVYGLGAGYWPAYRQKLQALTREQASAAIQKFLQPDKLSIIAVGNAKEFAKELEKYGPARVIKSDDVDFIAPDLLKAKPKVAATPEGAAKAKALVAKALESMGGREKLAAVKDMTTAGKLKLTLPQGAMEADTTEEVLYPDRFKMVMKLPMGVITQAYDAGAAWMGQGTTVRDLPPNMAPELAKSVPAASGGIGMLLAAADGQAEAQLIDDSTVLWKSPAFEAALGFDAATGRLVKMTMKTLGMTGPAEVQTTFDDFRAEGGLTLPYKESMAQNGQQVGVRTITERKVNSGLKPESFGKPK